MKLHRIAMTSALGLALFVSACGDDGSTTSTGASPASTAASATTAASGQATDIYGGPVTTAAPATTVAASANATVKLATVGKYGSILVDNAGRTLYLFEKDTGTTTACANDPCKTNWPALAATGTGSVGAGLDASKLSTVAGQVPGHVVYAGHLLYYYVGDKAPGDVNGINIPAWFPLDATGKKVEKPA